MAIISNGNMVGPPEAARQDQGLSIVQSIGRTSRPVEIRPQVPWMFSIIAT